MGVGSGQKVNTGYMRSNASMGYANMANPMYNAYPGLNLAYYNSLAMVFSLPLPPSLPLPFACASACSQKLPQHACL
jgi:hypothetical protein